MSSRTIIVCIFFSLVSSTIMARESLSKRKNVKFTFFQDTSDEDIKSNLNQMGIIFDEHSTINIHEEKNYIDLTCFNCIVRSVDSNSYISGSINELTTK